MIAIKKPAWALRPLAILTFLLLTVQFLIGMVVNLYVVIPTSHPGAEAPEYFSGVVQGVGWAITHGALALQVHAALGLLLLLSALSLVVLSIMSRRRAWIIASLIGLLGILGAGFNGASFVNYGHDFSSLIMAGGFLIALLSYAIGLYTTR